MKRFITILLLLFITLPSFAQSQSIMLRRLYDRRDALLGQRKSEKSKLDDPRRVCLRCIDMRNIKFTRQMIHHRMEDAGGTYVCICPECNGWRENHKIHRRWGRSKLNERKCRVNYTCRIHEVTWTEEQVIAYKESLEDTFAIQDRIEKINEQLKIILFQIKSLEDMGVKAAPRGTGGADTSIPSSRGKADASGNDGTFIPIKRLRLQLGLSSRIKFRLDDSSIKALGKIDNVGVDRNLQGKHSNVYFGLPRCIAVLPNLKQVFWNLKYKLDLKCNVSRITKVEIVRSGREMVQLREPNSAQAGNYPYSPCGVTYNATTIMIWDDLPGSSEYIIDIYFE